MLQARPNDTESHERERTADRADVSQPPDQPRPALGRRPWFALLRRARSLRRFAFAMRRESVARSDRGLTLVDSNTGWMVHGVALLTGFLQRLQGAGAGTDRILMRAGSVHGRGLDIRMLVVGIDSTGRVLSTAWLPPGRFLRVPGATWVLELADHDPSPVPGARLDIYARGSERQTDPVCDPHRESR